MPDTLPDDVAALRALVLTAWAERDAERAANERLIEERDQLAGQNDRLRHLLRHLQRTQFGRRSEKLDPDQRLCPSLRFGHQERLRPAHRSRGFPTVNADLISRCGCLS
jgi:hypothetical protein